MEYKAARALASIVRILYRFGLISADKADYMIDQLQIKLFTHELKREKCDDDGVPANSDLDK